MDKYGMKILFLVVCVLSLLKMVLAEISSTRKTPVVRVVQENAEAVVNIATEHIILLRENPS